MNLTRTELEILAGERKKYPRELVDRCLKSFNELGLLRGEELTSRGVEILEPYKVRRAIFLAAGFGKRLMPITINTPKYLVRVHGVRILDRLIDACLAAEIEEIYVVRGYLAEQFDVLLKKYPTIKFIENPLYDKADNIYTAICAANFLCNAQWH